MLNVSAIVRSFNLIKYKNLSQTFVCALSSSSLRITKKSFMATVLFGAGVFQKPSNTYIKGLNADPFSSYGGKLTGVLVASHHFDDKHLTVI